MSDVLRARFVNVNIESDRKSRSRHRRLCSADGRVGRRTERTEACVTINAKNAAGGTVISAWRER